MWSLQLQLPRPGPSTYNSAIDYLHVDYPFRYLEPYDQEWSQSLPTYERAQAIEPKARSSDHTPVAVPRLTRPLSQAITLSPTT